MTTYQVEMSLEGDQGEFLVVESPTPIVLARSHDVLSAEKIAKALRNAQNGRAMVSEAMLRPYADFIAMAKRQLEARGYRPDDAQFPVNQDGVIIPFEIPGADKKAYFTASARDVRTHEHDLVVFHRIAAAERTVRELAAA